MILGCLPCSPAINAGINDSLDLATDTIDINGNPRIVQTTVDMGAYELQGILFSDTTTVITTNDDGCGSLRFAVANADVGDTIRFDHSINGDTILLLTSEICLGNGMHINGNGIDSTIIDGANNDRIFCFEGDSASIKGCTMQNGNTGTNGPPPWISGGAITNSGYLTIDSCLIKDNIADFIGAVLIMTVNFM